MIMLFIYGCIFLLMSMISFLLWMYFILLNKILIFEWLIFKFYSMKFNMFLLFDEISMIFFMIIFTISSMIMFYSMEYMNIEYYLQKRFNYLLIMFIMSMLLMISSPSILSILLGWDGLGLISYCLVIFYQNFKAYSSGLLTIILNRIGDVSLLMMIAIMSSKESFNLMLYNSNKWIMILMMLMIMTKSAQMPFSSWLPAAMMAPTPISSLVHSSTLVTAGVYLLIRYINFMNNNYLDKLLMISSMTYLMASFIANFEFDIKKVIALSTLSQLGLMMSILSLKMNDLTFLHLVIHAMFKSLMFMCAGSFIHYLNNMQDLRKYKGMFYMYPFKSLIFMFSNLCLCGFPFLGAFYSKDLIIEYFFLSKLKYIHFLNLMLGTMFSVSYSIRLMLILMSNKYPKLNSLYIKENYLMAMCMMFMMLFTILFSKFYLNMKYLMYNNNMSLFMKIMIIKIMLFSIFIGYYFFKNMNLTKYLNLGNWSKNMIYLNMFYKISYLKLLNYIMKYEIHFDKNLNLIYTINLNKFKKIFLPMTMFNLFYNLNFSYHLLLLIFLI